MAYFTYKGRDRRGRLKEGRLKAGSQREATALLREDGVTPFQVSQMDGLLFKDIHLGNPVKNQDFVIYLRQFSTLIDAGISLIEATYILKDQTSSRGLKKTLSEVADDLEAGHAFSDAAAKHRKVFPLMFINMMKAGEVGGNIDEILERMAMYYEKQYELRQKIVSALSYPLVVGMIAFAIVIFMLSFVVPRFASMFSSFASDIPPFTQFVLGLGDFFSSFWWAFIFLPVILYLIYKYSLKYERFAYVVDYAKMRVPYFGGLVQKAALARMTRTLSSLFNSSVPVLEAVQITERIVENKVIEEELQKARESLESGESMAKPLTEHWAFPSMVTQMISVGEKTGALDQMLNKAADFYEREIDHATDRIKALIEPIMIVILALIVGAIVMAIAVPMFSIFENIQ
ncbi:type II secretion system F family protein [Halobacillus locisalis]|uniref:Type II secretion system F family protein n=1 Tax=Halobacillus locisalis TaxID=220753 RepID=A0A838CMF3_9BACI|nr:type II secretion system F family protein [Halobacillus locisalis]MBA2173442.1 type II secretion system F family protein [Halobacillus locisalis]